MATQHAPVTMKSPEMLTKGLHRQGEGEMTSLILMFTLRQTASDVPDDEHECPFRLLGELLIVSVNACFLVSSLRQ